MKKFIPSLKAMIPFGILCVLAAIFSFTASADSTITIPIEVPKDYPDRKVTMSLKIPAQTEPPQDRISPLTAGKLGFLGASARISQCVG